LSAIRCLPATQSTQAASGSPAHSETGTGGGIPAHGAGTAADSRSPPYFAAGTTTVWQLVYHFTTSKSNVAGAEARPSATTAAGASGRSDGDSQRQERRLLLGRGLPGGAD
jgi:hypothetical protein